jgi:Asp-tRNA(Asn)/Glu-tRNA(Gln) amidotransferase A subunit family amidase
MSAPDSNHRGMQSIGAPQPAASDASSPPAAPAHLGRRGFLRALGVTAAAGLVLPDPLTAAPRSSMGTPGGPVAPAALPGAGTVAWNAPFGNGEAPAIQFQAYPGGTGAYLERLARERGYAAFERRQIAVEPWSGAVPRTEEEWVFQPVHRLAALLRAGHTTSEALTERYLARLERLDPVLLCAVTILPEQARAEARRADAELRAGRDRGPLHGIPYGLKDLFAMRGVRTTWGAREFEHRVIDEDSEVLLRLREAGAVLLAKLATGLFAQGDGWYRGRTRNPWNVEQGSSGSSAGPASAVAAGCVAFGIGTETQGSIVSPAIRCGITALRPTFGRVSRHGGMVLAWSMDKVGPMCRTAEDCALVFDAIHGADPKDASTLTAPFQWERSPDLSRLRIGHDERAPESVVATLRELGAELTPMPERPSVQGVSSLGVETAVAFDFHHENFPEDGAAAGVGAAGAAARFTRGRAVSALDYLQSQRRRLQVMHEMAELMAGFDMYVSGSGDVGLTNQTGHPAVVLPYTFAESGSGQPVCTTLIGDLFADDRILAVASAFQQATAWHRKHPVL